MMSTGRVFQADGTPVGAEFLITTTASGHQQMPSVALDTDGNFVVTWANEAEDDDTPFRVMARRFDATGTALGDAFRVSELTPDTDAAEMDPVVDMDRNGNFIIVWGQESWQHDLDDADGVFGRLYSSDGTATSEVLRLSAEDEHADLPDVAMDDDGSFVVAWARGSQHDDLDVAARRFAADGTALGDSFLVNQTTEDDQDVPAVAIDDDGGFIVTWSNFTSGRRQQVRSRRA